MELKKVMISGLTLGVLGLLVGYLIFGQISGEYIGIQRLINPSQGLLDELVDTVTGVGKVRQNILVTGVVGAAFGFVLGAVRK